MNHAPRAAKATPTSGGSTGSTTVVTNPATGNTTPTTGTPNPATPTPTPVNGPLPANVATALDTIYEEFENGTLSANQNGPGKIEIQGNDVGVMIKVNNPDDFASDVAAAEGLGMQVQTTSAASDLFAGFLPIAELPAVAQLPDAPVIVPMYGPLTRRGADSRRRTFSPLSKGGFGGGGPKRLRTRRAGSPTPQVV